MAYKSPDPLVSGKPYPVVDIAGEPPTSLTQFSGQVEFGIDRGNAVSRVKGVGKDHDQGVKFLEKDLDSSGKDVRAWLVRQQADGRITAETLAVF